MNKKSVKKGAKEKAYIDALKKHPEGLTKVKIREITGLKTSTEGDITKRLLDKKVGKKDAWDEKSGKIVNKYYLLDFQNLADPDELSWIMETYTKASLDNNTDKIQQLQKDIESICLCKKIRDKDFIKFLVEKAQETDNNTRILRKCLGHLSTSILKTIETEEESLELLSGYHEKYLLSIVEGSINSFTKIILDGKREYMERIEALDVLRQFSCPEKIDVAFELLKKVDTKERKYNDKELQEYLRKGTAIYVGKDNLVSEIEIFYPFICELILFYAKINTTDCRKKLYDLITPETDRVIKNIVMELLEEIRCRNGDRAIAGWTMKKREKALDFLYRPLDL
jgi:hypothetical protein